MLLSAPQGVDPADVSLEERVEVVRMQSFSFDTRSDQSQDWPVAVGIDASSWAAGVLVVLVHQLDAWGGDSRLQIAVQAIDLDPDDPKQIFAASTVASVVLDSSITAGTARVESLTPPWGSRLQVVLRPLQRPVEAEKEQRSTLTILLVARRQGLPGVPHLLMQRASDR